MAEIRRATAGDVEELVRFRCAFLNEVNGCDQPPEGFEDGLRAYLRAAVADGSFAAWAAWEGGRVVAAGCVCYTRIVPGYSNPTGEIAYIQNMYTLPEYRRLGLASAIFARLIDEAKERGVRRVSLHATVEGRKVYEKFGFQPKADEMVLTVQ